MKVKIEKLDYYGRGIAKIDDKICFIENALPQEEVNIKIMTEKKKYSEGIVTKYLTKSERRNHPCHYQDICGGCDIIHLSKEDQEQFKTDTINHILPVSKHIEFISDKKELFYRNKVVFHVKDHKLGFYKKGSNDLIEVEECLLLDSQINKLIPKLQEIVKDEKITKIMVRVGNKTKEVMVAIDGIIKKEINLDVDVLYINEKLVTKKKQIISYIGDKKFYVSKDSFFQVNHKVTELLYNEIKKHIKSLDARHVLDLYCGTGTIGIYIAEWVKSVIGVDVVESAIQDAKKNKDLNKTTNINFYCGNVNQYEHLIKNNIDTIIVDPPRSGLNKKIISKIIEMKIKNIIYVSCDPFTLKRDLSLFEKEYSIIEIKTFDMFPNTHHIETMVLLQHQSK